MELFIFILVSKSYHTHKKFQDLRLPGWHLKEETSHLRQNNFDNFLNFDFHNSLYEF